MQVVVCLGQQDLLCFQLCVRVHTLKHTDTDTHTLIRMCTHTHTHTHTHAHTQVVVCLGQQHLLCFRLCACVHTLKICRHRYILACICAHTRTRTHTHAHSHTQVVVCLGQQDSRVEGGRHLTKAQRKRTTAMMVCVCMSGRVGM